MPRVNQLHLGCSSLHCASLLHKETVKMTQPIIDLHILGIVNSAWKIMMFIPCIHIGQSIFQYPHTVKCLRSMYHKKKIRYLEHKLEGPKNAALPKIGQLFWILVNEFDTFNNVK